MADFDRCVEAAKIKLGCRDVILKKEQIDVLQSLFDGNDTIGVLPTGFGKSLIFQLLPFMLEAQFNKRKIVIVVAPITAIMEEQVHKLCSQGIMACYLKYGGSCGIRYEEGDLDETTAYDSEETITEVPISEIITGKYNLVYTHPECLFQQSISRMLRSETYRDQLGGIVVDEVHMIQEWKATIWVKYLSKNLSSKGGLTAKLDQKWLQRAQNELGETDEEIDSTVQTLRTWVVQQTWLKSPTDHRFLLRFLRVRKFSQLGARETLVNYWTNRTRNSGWFCPKINPTDPRILEIVRTGFFIYMPGTDSQGRRIIIERPGCFNMGETKKKYGIDIIHHALFCICDALCMDERVQVNGLAWLHDATLASHDVTQLYNIEFLKRAIPLLQKSYPVRIKSLNVYNFNFVFEFLLKFAKNLMSEKLRKKLTMHGKSMASVYKEIEPSSLPREYLPDDYTGPCAGTLQDVIENMVNDLSQPEVMNHVRDLNSGKYGVDLEKRKSSDTKTPSFRRIYTN